ncbi:MAG: phosphatidylserine decarboxylase [Verrucomicrobiota bacterium]|nr:phosphatidylserine decarboxylase [Verrucomicrobiota bacterium]
MIQYINRKTGEVCTEKVYGEATLALLYGDGLASKILSYTLLPLIVHSPLVSRLYGYLQKRPSSRSKIEPFIETYGIDKSEFETTQFNSFNDFFIRKLKPTCRPVIADPRRSAMPADGRYLVFPTFDRFFVKGQEFSLFSFLQNSVLARRFADGAMLIARLCPVDYHRFHFPCDGLPHVPRLINGSLFSVNPIAIRKRVSIFSENKRVITEIDTDAFGTLLFIEIGAASVGTIQQTFTPNKTVQKGQEKGYFEFGGSCIVLLFEKGRIQFDPDLIENTRKGYETLCRFGESMGLGTF